MSAAHITAFLIVLGGIFAAFFFITTTANPFEWAPYTRFLFVACAVVALFYTSD
jgi:hypothetical protein